jgi:hypothetical protein
MRTGFVRAILLSGLAAALTPNARAQSLQVTGQAGVLGEWELTATVAETSATGRKQFVGPVTLKHTGLCTQDGPEQKSGELRFELSRSASRIKATLLVDGVACSYEARKLDAYNGVLKCPDRSDVPLLMWVK